MRIPLASPPPDAAADVAAWQKAVAAMPIEMRAALAPMFEPTVIRARRIAERDAALVRIAIANPGSGRAQADAAHRALSQYAAGAWRFEQARDVPRNPVMHTDAHRFLKMNAGKVPAARSLRKILRWALSPEERAHGSAQRGANRRLSDGVEYDPEAQG